MRSIVFISIVVASIVLLGQAPVLAQGWNFDCAKMTSQSSRARCLKQQAARAGNVEKVKARREARGERKTKPTSTKKKN